MSGDVLGEGYEEKHSIETRFDLELKSHYDILHF